MSNKKKKWFRYHLKIHHWTNGDKDYSIIEQVVTKGERPKDFYRFYTDISVKVPLTNAAGSLMADQDGSLLAKGRSEKVPIEPSAPPMMGLPPASNCNARTWGFQVSVNKPRP